MRTIKQNQDLSQRLTELVRSLPGVTVVYPTAALPAAVRGHIVSTVTGPQEGDALVLVRLGPVGARVSVNMGVSAHDSASEQCRRVHAAVVAHLSAEGISATDVRVRVSSID